MKHELWIDKEGMESLVLAGKHGEDARALIGSGSRLVWTFDADSYFEAMTKYYEYMGWGDYHTDYPEHDKKTYAELGWE